jgi:hypothetical protein
LTDLADRENLLFSEAATLVPYDDKTACRHSVYIKHLLDNGVREIHIPDTIEVLYGLAMNWAGRLGVVNVRVALNDEQVYRREVPACVTLETTKLRYMAETLVNRYVLII